MGRVTLHIDGRGGAGLSGWVAGRLVPWLLARRSGRGGAWLWLGPNEPWLRDRRALVFDHLEGRGAAAALFSPPFETLSGYVAACSKRPGLPRPIAALERRVLLAEVLADIELPAAWERIRNTSGLIEALGEEIDALGRAGVLEGLELLERFGSEARSDVRLLARILDAYRERLAARKLADAPQAIARVTELLERGHVGAPELLVLDGFLAPDRASLRLLHALAENAHETHIWLTDPCGIGAGAPGCERGAAAALSRTLEAWRARFPRELEIQATGAVVEPSDDPLRRACRLAVRAEPPPRDERGERQALSRLLVARASSCSREMAFAARVLRRLRRANPTARIALALPPDPERVALVHELLPRAGLSYVLHVPQPLADAPPIAAALALLRAAETGLERQAVMDALCSSYVVVRARSGERLPIPALGRLAREAGVIGGEGARSWRLAFERHRDGLEARLRSTRDAGEEEREAGCAEGKKNRREPSARERRQLALYRRALEPFCETLERIEALGGNATAREHEQRLSALLEHLEVRSQAARGADPHALARDIAALSRMAQALETLVRALGPDTRLEFGRWQALVKRALTGERLRANALIVRGEEPAPIEVWSTPDAFGRRFDHLLALGLEHPAWQGGKRSTRVVSFERSERKRLGLPEASDEALASAFNFYETLALQPVEGELLLSFVAEPERVVEEVSEPLAVLLSHVRPRGGKPLEVGRGGRVAAEQPEASGHLVWDRHLALGLGLREGGEGSGHEELAALLREAAPAVLGGGHALLDGIAAAIARRDAPTPGSYEGVLAGGVLERVRAWVGKRRFSPSRLERYLRCPFRSFVCDVLGLEPLVDPEEDRSARALGDFVHLVLERFYEGGWRPPKSEEQAATWIRAAARRMREVFERTLAEHEQTLDRFARTELEELTRGLEALAAMKSSAPETHSEIERGALAAFILTEAALAIGFEPRWREQSVSLPLELGALGPLWIDGKIDRIDLAPDETGYVVYDYKTGRTEKDVKSLWKGIDVQLPIYLLAARTLVSPGARPVGAAWYQLGKPYEERLLNPIADPSARGRWGPIDRYKKNKERTCSLEALLERLPRALEHAIRAMAAGRFHPGVLSEEEKGCRFCEARAVCRVDHERMRALGAAKAPAVFVPLALMPDEEGGGENGGAKEARA